MHKGFVDKYLPWPVVFALVILLVLIVYPFNHSTGGHEDQLLALATFLSMSITFIIGALIERFKQGAFDGDIIVFYRFWLACGSIGTVAFWLILRAFPVPIWEIKPRIVAVCYLSMFFGSLLVAWLISRGSHSKTQSDEK